MRLWLVFASFALLGACASGTVERACDPAVEACACDIDSDCPLGYQCGPDGTCRLATGDGPDAGPAADAAPRADAAPAADAGPPPVDAAPLAGFGEPCSDQGQCASQICMLTVLGGVCTKACNDGVCPPGYGCYGVLGVIEPGQVANVCVAEISSLCTACQSNAECGLQGQDMCLSYDNGTSFCARDCSVVLDCPDGYTCQTVNVDGTDHRQCVPASGACDCNAGSTGDTEACGIQTPFGVCQGARTCQGDGGWGQCEPPAPTDEPDGTFTDDNCDGIDGDIDAAIFVAAASGADTATCGLTFGDPCRSINHGIGRAAAAGLRQVYVQAGDYGQVVVLRDGIHVYGGYDTGWQRGARSSAAHQVRIIGAKDRALDGGDDEYLSVRAHDLPSETRLADVVIVGPTANESRNLTGGRSGHSSFGVHADGAAQLVLERISIQAGNGAPGINGSTGLSATQTAVNTEMRGLAGQPGSEGANICNDSTRTDGGGQGINSNPLCTGADGGAGGRGGTKDADCPFNWDSRPGSAGQNATQSVAGGYGAGGGGGSVCTGGGVGRAGRVQNGAAGTGGASGGFLRQGYWYANFGTAGGVGASGSGGGGGGGGGGCSTGVDAYGGGGGGGGAGGCAAKSGGGGGGGGGGSFGVFAVGGSFVRIRDCVITRGNGGAGGRGGTGGRGQSGGPGGAGGLDSTAPDGGRGGDGAHGGHGGGGGGGASGHSVGLFAHEALISHDCSVSAGAAGAVGAAGLSAPTAPIAEDDGNDGTAGAQGVLAISCPSLTSC